MTNPVLEACQAELRRRGVEEHRVEHTGAGHLELQWSDDKLVIPASLSDWRAPTNAVSTLRQIDREPNAAPSEPPGATGKGKARQARQALDELEPREQSAGRSAAGARETQGTSE